MALSSCAPRWSSVCLARQVLANGGHSHIWIELATVKKAHYCCTYGGARLIMHPTCVLPSCHYDNDTALLNKAKDAQYHGRWQWQQPDNHPVMTWYIYHSTTLADIGRNVSSQLLNFEPWRPLLKWPHNHGLPIGEAGICNVGSLGTLFQKKYIPSLPPLTLYLLTSFLQEHFLLWSKLLEYKHRWGKNHS